MLKKPILTLLFKLIYTFVLSSITVYLRVLFCLEYHLNKLIFTSLQISQHRITCRVFKHRNFKHHSKIKILSDLIVDVKLITIYCESLAILVALFPKPLLHFLIIASSNVFISLSHLVFEYLH